MPRQIFYEGKYINANTGKIDIQARPASEFERNQPRNSLILIQHKDLHGAACFLAEKTGEQLQQTSYKLENTNVWKYTD